MEGSMTNATESTGTTSNTNRHVEQVVQRAHEELRLLLQEKAEVVGRIRSIKQTIFGLANLIGDEILDKELLRPTYTKSDIRKPGLTKACRLMLMEAGRALSARDVCDQIQDRNPDVLARHTNPMASVTTVLNRLVQYGEAQGVLLNNGRHGWQWVADFHSQSYQQ